MRRLLVVLPRHIKARSRTSTPFLLRRPLSTPPPNPTNRLISPSLVVAGASTSSQEWVSPACWVAAMMLMVGGGAVAGLENYIETDKENTTAHVAEYKVSRSIFVTVLRIIMVWW